jgi:hypothetical protein
MIPFEININKEGTGFDAGFPMLKFTNNKYDMLHELNRCDADYIIDEVLPALDEVLAGEQVTYEFGYDATLIDFYNNKCIVSYNYGDDVLEAESKDVYEFMRAWCDSLIAFRNRK